MTVTKARIPDPWRAVMADPEPGYYEGSHNALNRSNNRTARWWELTLECGHQVERTARLGDDGEPTDPPKRVRCEPCGIVDRQAARTNIEGATA